jgi:hypothetical protein
LFMDRVGHVLQRSLLRGTLIPRGGRPYCGTTKRARGNVAPGCGHRGRDTSDPALLPARPGVRHGASRHHPSSPRGGHRRPGGPPPCARLSAGGLIVRRGLAPGSPSSGTCFRPRRTPAPRTRGRRARFQRTCHPRGVAASARTGHPSRACTPRTGLSERRVAVGLRHGPNLTPQARSAQRPFRTVQARTLGSARLAVERILGRVGVCGIPHNPAGTFVSRRALCSFLGSLRPGGKVSGRHGLARPVVRRRFALNGIAA